MMSLKCSCAAPTAVRTQFRSGAPLATRRVAVSHRAARLVTRAAVDKAAVLSDVRGIISEQLGKNLDEVKADSKFVDLGADSLDTVEIMMALEEKFDLQLDEEGAEKISTVQEAADLIAGQVGDA